MNPVIGALLLLLILGSFPAIMYYAISVRNRKTKEQQDFAQILANEVQGMYVPQASTFQDNAIGVFKGATMKHVITLPASPSGQSATFFAMFPFTGEGSRMTAYKYIAHRMYYCLPATTAADAHLYFSSAQTDLAKKEPQGLTKTAQLDDSMKPVQSPVTSHALYCNTTQPAEQIIPATLLTTLRDQFADCDIEIINAKLYVIGFCGDKVENAAGYKPFILRCQQYIKL